jgi:hypothetical protein
MEEKSIILFKKNPIILIGLKSKLYQVTLF